MKKSTEEYLSQLNGNFVPLFLISVCDSLSTNSVTVVSSFQYQNCPKNTSVCEILQPQTDRHGIQFT